MAAAGLLVKARVVACDAPVAWRGCWRSERRQKSRRSFVLFPEAAHDKEGEDVEAEGDHEEREAQREADQRLRTGKVVAPSN